jgi:hypothetical protein
VSLLLVALVSLVVSPGSGRAAAPPGRELSRPGQSVTWTGSLSTPDPLGCGEVVSRGCDTTLVTVVAPKGAYVTVAVDDGLYVRVDEGGRYVGGNGMHSGLRSSGSVTSSTTFQQVRAGKVVYRVGVSAMVVDPLQPQDYRATASLAGKALDREGECFVGDSGLTQLREPDDGAVLRLSLRLVTAPADAAEVRQKVIPAVVETFARIDVKVRVSLDVMPLKAGDTYPFEQVRRRYGGVRPAGVDVVHVLSDNFSGGFADCLGGIAYPEKAFSTGSVHYAPEGTVRIPTVPAAGIVAHEVGHLLGGQHQMGNCVEAVPQQAQRPASDGSVGPCTVMSPGAAQISETYSTLERATIRSFVRRWARG